MPESNDIYEVTSQLLPTIIALLIMALIRRERDRYLGRRYCRNPPTIRKLVYPILIYAIIGVEYIHLKK